MRDNEKIVLSESFEKKITFDKIERWRYPRFFADEFAENSAVLRGGEARHCAQVLRMKEGDLAVLCDGEGSDFLSRISFAQPDEIVFELLDRQPNDAEASISLRLFQCLPKADKMDFIVQKAAELGACEVIPVLSKRCVSRPDEKGSRKKAERWQKIAFEASKQCGRGKILRVRQTVSFAQAVNEFLPEHTGILFYECGGSPLSEILSGGNNGTFDVFIGSEGGFEPAEAELAEERGIALATLGKRILRCETAPVAAISILMNLTGNM